MAVAQKHGTKLFFWISLKQTETCRGVGQFPMVLALGLACLAPFLGCPSEARGGGRDGRRGGMMRGGRRRIFPRTSSPFVVFVVCSFLLFWGPFVFHSPGKKTIFAWVLIPAYGIELDTLQAHRNRFQAAPLAVSRSG